MKCSEVKWSELKILGEVWVLWLIYSYVAVCRFCAVRCAIVVCFCLLFSNYSNYVFNIIFYVCFLFCIFYILCFCIVFVFFVYCFAFCIKVFFASLLATATGWKTNCSKSIPYPFISYHWRPSGTCVKNNWSYTSAPPVLINGIYNQNLLYQITASLKSNTNDRQLTKNLHTFQCAGQILVSRMNNLIR